MTDLITQNAELRRRLDDRFARMHHEMCCALVAGPVKINGWASVFKKADYYIAEVKKREGVE